MNSDTRGHGSPYDRFTLWFQDGGGRTTIWGRRELIRYANQYDFDADEVASTGETNMICAITEEVVGGVFREGKGSAR